MFPVFKIHFGQLKKVHSVQGLTELGIGITVKDCRSLKANIHLFSLAQYVLSLCVHGKSLQLCLTLCNPGWYGGPPGSPVHGILRTRILELVAVPSSTESSQPRDRTCISYVSCIGSSSLPPAPSGKPRSSSPYSCMLISPGVLSKTPSASAHPLLNTPPTHTCIYQCIRIQFSPGRGPMTRYFSKTLLLL